VSRRWLVDGMNVIGSRPDGWWRDRAGAKRGLVEALRTLAEAEGAQLTVVFDGRPVRLPDPRPIEVEFAPSADDAIVRRAAADSDPGTLTVVTSDAELAERVRACGPGVVGAGAFRRRLDEARDAL
jgi:predicted RNA-binding protein with PIN domain